MSLFLLKLLARRQAALVPFFLITLYVPPTGASELHLFTVDDLLAEDDPHIPAWFPQDFNLTSSAG